MLTTRESVRMGAVIIAGVAFGLARFVIYDYVPPEGLIRALERSVFVATGMQMPAKMVFVAVAVSMMAVFFRLVQQRWPGRRGVKGLVFGASLGIIWTFGFFTGSAFLGTAEDTVSRLAGVSRKWWTRGGFSRMRTEKEQDSGVVVLYLQGITC